MFGKASLIITIVLFSYSILGFGFLFVLRLIKMHKRRKEIKAESEKPLNLEVAMYENQETISNIEK